MKDIQKLIFIITIFLLLLIRQFALAESIRNVNSSDPFLLDRGGPDVMGYYFIDSHEYTPQAPVFFWKEIYYSGTNLQITEDDQTVGPIPIGFHFKYYSVQYDSFYVCSNGFISFTSNSEEFTNDPIPDTHDPNNILAVFWDDLAPDSASNAFYYTNHRDTLIVEWKNFARASGEGAYTFEAILTGNCDINFQYISMTGILDSHTIGIENQNGTVGLEYVFNAQKNETGSAIRFSRGMHSVLLLSAGAPGDFGSYLYNYNDISNVDNINVHNQTPSLTDLTRYDAVCVWSDSSFADPVALGNVLADFLDQGGAVILLQNCFVNELSLQGRIMNEYSPFTVSSGNGNDTTLGFYDAGHPLMRNVHNIISGIRPGNVSLAHSPVLVASYGDGTPMAAYNPLNNLIGINFYIGNHHRYLGDAIELCHNAVNFAVDGPAQILLVTTEPQAAPAIGWQLKQYPDIHSIHTYDASSSTPSVSFLNLYSAVDVWPNGQFFDRQFLGDRLADYVDNGGGVVLHQFCLENSQLLGRIMTDYSPYAAGTNQNHDTSLGQFDRYHPLMLRVNDITDHWSAHVSLQNGGIEVAAWDDSTGFVAYNPNHRVVAVNGFIGSNHQYTGDMMVLTHNAINFVERPTKIDEDNTALPNEFRLSQNYPNPFNPTTTIAYDLPAKSDTNIEIFNLLGQRVAFLSQGIKGPGHHEIIIDAHEFASGVYFYRLVAGNFSSTKKMIVLK